MLRNRFLPLLILPIVLAGCASTLPHNLTGREPSIRVCVAKRSAELTLHISDGAVLQSVSRRFRLDGHSSLKCVLLEDGSIDVLMDGRKARTISGAFRCFYRQPGSVFGFEDASYTDTMLVASDGEGLYLVNILPLEDYLKNVVPNEIGRNRKDNEFEAVKAQAILARTYALGKITLPLARLFDVHADHRDQVFSGVGGRDAFSTRAVEATRGVALSFNGQLAECYYHSTCGGRTEASSLIWKRPQSKPYLAGVSDRGRAGDFCRIAPSYRWSEQYGREELEHMLRTFMPAANDAIRPEDLPDRDWHLLDMNIIKRMPSGRVSIMQIVMGNRARQRAYYLHGDNIRRALRRQGNERPLRSALFDIHIDRDRNRWITRVRIDGGGAGHGVGMCQWGAIGRARAGGDAGDILSAYFPGTASKTLY